MTPRQLLQTFAHWSAQEEPLVLASVYETLGSTYSKVGAQMLINASGDFQGMLSGGCLEGDLAERARQVLDSGNPQTVTYDLGKNDEELWGLGVGCDGLMRIFLQTLRPASGYQPFASMAQAFAGDTTQVAATVLESASDAVAPGAALVMIDGNVVYDDTAQSVTQKIAREASHVLAAGSSCTRQIQCGGDAVRVLLTVLEPPPRVLVLGAGLDAEPLVGMIDQLGWRVTVQDHRPAYIENGDFSAAEQVFCEPAEQLNQFVELDRFSACIVMSHHLATDRQYLELLAHCRIPYIGLLGPRDRRERLLVDLGDVAALLQGRLHGPAGLEIGGRGPASIALSIAAEVHQQLML